MIRIAVIGEIGSGKSHIAKQFGGPVFNADNVVNKIYKKNKKCYIRLKKEFPNYITSFPIKKNNLTRVILQNPKNIRKINKVIHPKVRFEMNKFIKKNKNRKFVILDIPLYLENKINKKNDIIIFVDAVKKIIFKKLKKRRNFNPRIIKVLKKLQLPVETKKNRSDFVIKNNFNNKLLKKNVKMLVKKIIKNA